MLRRLRIQGYKSIANADIELGPLNILIGANGAGKSNLLTLFKLLNAVAAGNLQTHCAEAGGADSLFCHGPAHTSRIRIELEFTTGTLAMYYAAELVPGPDGRVRFGAEETAAPAGTSGEVAGHGPWNQLGAGDGESALLPRAAEPAIASLLAHLRGCRVFQFHDTAENSPLRRGAPAGGASSLASNGANLAPVLARLQRERPDYYARILGTIRQIVPFLDDFVFPSGAVSGPVQLRWRQRGSPAEFGPHHLSDGTLRALALFTLLLQPAADLPPTITLDEPELGLHPYAVGVLASLIGGLAGDTQILVATQSPYLLEHFQPEEVIVVEQTGGASTFQRLDRVRLQGYLDQYSLGELWQKNVIGGRPSA